MVTSEQFAHRSSEMFHISVIHYKHAFAITILVSRLELDLT